MASSSLSRLMDFCTVAMLVSRPPNQRWFTKYIWHRRASSALASLAFSLGSHEQHVLALGGHFAHEAGGVLEHFQGFLQVDYVDSVAFAEDVFLHLRIPALGLVPEVNTGFEQFLHRYCGRRLPPKLSVPRQRARSKARFTRGTRAHQLHPTDINVWRTGSACARPFGRTSCARAGAGRGSESRAS